MSDPKVIFDSPDRMATDQLPSDSRHARQIARRQLIAEAVMAEGTMRIEDLAGRLGVSLLAAHRVLKPRDRNHEQRSTEQPEENVDPRDRHVIGGHAEGCPDGAERSVMFHERSPTKCDRARSGCRKVRG